MFREGRLDEQRQQLLKTIGFVFKLADAQREELWHSQYRLLKAFYQKHGHTEIPPRSDPNSNPQLLKWCRRQRETFQNDKLSDKRKALLEEITFDFQGDRSNRSSLVEEQRWNEKYQELKEFAGDKGNKAVDLNQNFDPTGDKKGIETWIRKQKTAFRQGNLSAERQSALENLGVEFGESKMVKGGSTKDSTCTSSKEIRNNAPQESRKKRKHDSSEMKKIGSSLTRISEGRKRPQRAIV